MDQRYKLPFLLKAGYGIGDIGCNIFIVTSGLFLLFFLTNIMGVEPALAGVALLIPKLWDVVSDPIMGAISDVPNSRSSLFVIGADLMRYCAWSNPLLYRSLSLRAVFSLPETLMALRFLLPKTAPGPPRPKALFLSFITEAKRTRFSPAGPIQRMRRPLPFSGAEVNRSVVS